MKPTQIIFRLIFVFCFFFLLRRGDLELGYVSCDILFLQEQRNDWKQNISKQDGDSVNTGFRIQLKGSVTAVLKSANVVVSQIYDIKVDGDFDQNSKLHYKSPFFYFFKTNKGDMFRMNSDIHQKTTARYQTREQIKLLHFTVRLAFKNKMSARVNSGNRIDYLQQWLIKLYHSRRIQIVEYVDTLQTWSLY